MGDIVTIDEQIFTNIANAIRSKNGKETTYKPREMAAAIASIGAEPTKWIRPSNWPDYSKVDLTDQEVIYLTYDCTYTTENHISVLVSGAYTIKRGTLNNGSFTSVTSTNMTSGATFQEELPTNAGDYVVYQITPQSGSHITDFRFVSMTDPNSSVAWGGTQQHCIERYCRVPYHTTAWGNSQGVSASSHITAGMIADTIIGATPNGSLYCCYRTDFGGPSYVNIEDCSFVNVTTLQYMFYNSHLTQEIYLPHDLGSKCTNLMGMFQGCEKLITLNLSGWNTGSVTNFSGMFNGCSNLCQINGIEDFDFTSATNLSSMFNNCRMISFNSSKWETSTALTNCNSMFSGCWSLTALDLSGFVTSNVTTFSYMFYACEKIITLDLSSFVVSNKATTLASMFMYCYSLENIIRNKNWNTSNVTTFESMFGNCLMLKEIDISDFDFSNATTIKNMFYLCTRLEKIKATINLPALTNVSYVATFASSCAFLDDVSELIFTNCSYMPDFGYDRNLTYIKIPASVTNIPNNTFRDCGHLAIVDCRDLTAVPTLGGVNAFILNSNTQQKIIVPDNLYNTWIAATNWSNATLAARIISASDYEALTA